MSANPDTGSMVTYQFDCDDDEWSEWKQTVPRDKSLDTRLRELMRADVDGRVREASATTRRSQAAAEQLEQRQRAVAEHADSFSGVLDDAREAFADDPDARQEARVESLRAALAAVRESPRSKSEIQAAAYPEPAIGQNERTWFRKTVKPYLKDVAEYSNSDQKWHYSG